MERKLKNMNPLAFTCRTTIWPHHNKGRLHRDGTIAKFISISIFLEDLKWVAIENNCTPT